MRKKKCVTGCSTRTYREDILLLLNCIAENSICVCKTVSAETCEEGTPDGNTTEVTWSSDTKLSCWDCQYSDVRLCVPSELIVQTPLIGSRSTIAAQLVSNVYQNVDCENVYQYTFSYDVTQLVDEQPLTTEDISGVICLGCFTDWIEQYDDLLIRDNCWGQEICLTKEGSEWTCFIKHEEGRIDQIAHSLPVPPQLVLPVTYNSLLPGFEPAQANSEANLAELLAINVANPDWFFALNQGFYTNGSAHGLDVGEWYALSPTTPGELVLESSLDPNTQLIQRVLFVLNETCVYLDLCNCGASAGGGGGGGWELLGNAGTTAGTNFAGTTDDEPFFLATNSLPVMRYYPQSGGLAPSIVGGHDDNYINQSGYPYPGGVLAGGGGVFPTFNNYMFGSGRFGVIAGGRQNGFSSDGVDPDFETGAFSVIGGGAFNRIDQFSESYAGEGGNTIAGGEVNFITACSFNFIGGGDTNEILADGISGVFASGAFDYNGIACGEDNVILWGDVDDAYPDLGSNFIGGGADGLMESAAFAFIGGGLANTIDEIANSDGPMLFNSIPGGFFNELNATQRSAIGGGGRNEVIFEDSSVVAGGTRNIISNSVQIAPPARLSAFNYAEIPDSAGVANAILGGVANRITNGQGSAIVGGGFLNVGRYCFGYQSVEPIASWTPASGSQVNLSAQTSMAYFGDVDVWIGNIGNAARKLKFWEPNTDTDYSSAHFSSFQAQAQGANFEYVLPAAAGIAGDALRIASVVGDVVTLEWAA